MTGADLGTHELRDGEARIKDGWRDAYLCPLATQVLWHTCEEALATNGKAAYRGKKFFAWGYRWEEDGDPGRLGSYGWNLWTEHPSIGQHRDPFFNCYWRPNEAQGKACVPLLLDCRWFQGLPREDNNPPAIDDMWLEDSPISDFCINRHQGGVNALFCDSSARKVGLKELWTLKWHREYDTTGPWTKAGGVTPGDWPRWMRRFKDY
jgi:prepilin-type processing-associated H-X9-DG protein